MSEKKHVPRFAHLGGRGVADGALQERGVEARNVGCGRVHHIRLHADRGDFDADWRFALPCLEQGFEVACNGRGGRRRRLYDGARCIREDKLLRRKSKRDERGERDKECQKERCEEIPFLREDFLFRRIKTQTSSLEGTASFSLHRQKAHRLFKCPQRQLQLTSSSPHINLLL